jgi:DNA mismatch repair protein MutL
LVNPSLRLVLFRDGRRAKEYLPVGGVAERARSVVTGRALTEIETERDGVRLQALLGAPEDSRAGAVGLHLFVNGRPVRDRALARAVSFAYGSVLPPGRYPVGVVHVHVAPAEVDVNVHPQKAEVRFERGRAVYDAVTRALASRLGTSAWSGPSGPAARGADFWAERLGAGVGPDVATTIASIALGETPRSGEPDPWELGPIGETTAVAASVQTAPSAVAETAAPYAATAPLLPRGGAFGSLRVLGQVRRMIIVCEGADGLHLIDQHAADERVRFHRLRRAHRSREVVSQRLLFPERVDVSPAAAAVVEAGRDELLRVGIDCALVGPTTAALHAVPALVKRAAPARLLLDILDELDHAGGRAFGDAIDTALATMACHGSIRAGDELSREECEALLRNLDEIDDFAGHCPHGRPVVFSVSFGEIERRLRR